MKYIFIKAFAIVFAALALFAFVLMFAGCHTPYLRATKRFEKAYGLSPTAVAEGCVARFPNRVTGTDTVQQVVTNTVEVPGETVFINCDSVVKSNSSKLRSLNIIPVNCPPSTLTTTDNYWLITKHEIDSAAMYQMKHQRDSLAIQCVKIQTRLDASNTWKMRFFWVGLGLLIIDVLVVVWKFIKPKWL